MKAVEKFYFHEFQDYVQNIKIYVKFLSRNSCFRSLPKLLNTLTHNILVY